jgi:hypothetical protein
VAPCPVGEEEINRKKAQRRLKARMDACTRERLPALPLWSRPSPGAARPHENCSKLPAAPRQSAGSVPR